MSKLLFVLMSASAFFSFISTASAGKSLKKDQEEKFPASSIHMNPKESAKKALKMIPSETFVSSNLEIIKQCAREGEAFDFKGKTFGVVTSCLDHSIIAQERVELTKVQPISPKYFDYFSNFFTFKLSIDGVESGTLTIGKINKNSRTSHLIVRETIDPPCTEQKKFLFLEPAEQTAEENYTLAMKYKDKSKLQAVKILKYAADVQGYPEAALELSKIYPTYNTSAAQEKAQEYFNKYNTMLDYYYIFCQK